MPFCGDCGKALPESRTCGCGYIAPERVAPKKGPYKTLAVLNIIVAALSGIISILLLVLIFREEGLIEVVTSSLEYDMTNAFIFGIVALLGSIAFIAVPILSIFYAVSANQGNGLKAYKLNKINSMISIWVPVLLVLTGIIASMIKESTGYYSFIVAEMIFGDKWTAIVPFLTFFILPFGLIFIRYVKKYPPIDCSPFLVEECDIVAAVKDEGASITIQSATMQNVVGTASKISQSTIKIGKSIQLSAKDEESATVSIAGRTFKVGLIMKIVSIALCVLFFLPMISISTYGYKASANGWTSTFGISEIGMKMGGSFWFIFLLLLPAALFTAYQFRKTIAFIQGKLFLISTGLSCLCLLVFIISVSSVNSSLGGYARAGITFWSFLSILLYLLSGAISIGCLLSAKKNR